MLDPFVTVDVALFTVDEGDLKVLLVRRAKDPEAGRWALVGGAIRPDSDPDVEAAARRVLSTKVRVDVPHLEQVRVYSGPRRDPRGWSLSILLYALLPRDQVNAVVADRVEKIAWVGPDAPAKRLAFDHAQQLKDALAALRRKVQGGKLPLHLLPSQFTLTELQQTCEAVQGRKIDKGAFRRTVRGIEELVALDEYRGGSQRPAQLFRAADLFSF